MKLINYIFEKFGEEHDWPMEARSFSLICYNSFLTGHNWNHWITLYLVLKIKRKKSGVKMFRAKTSVVMTLNCQGYCVCNVAVHWGCSLRWASHCEWKISVTNCSLEVVLVLSHECWATGCHPAVRLRPRPDQWLWPGDGSGLGTNTEATITQSPFICD